MGDDDKTKIKMKKNCSRCGIKIKKGKEKKVIDFNRKGLKDATFYEDCFKWYLETRK